MFDIIAPGYNSFTYLFSSGMDRYQVQLRLQFCLAINAAVLGIPGTTRATPARRGQRRASPAADLADTPPNSPHLWHHAHSESPRQQREDAGELVAFERSPTSVGVWMLVDAPIPPLHSTLFGSHSKALL